jgi:hypothetical protein
VGALPRAASWGAGRAAALGARALAQRLLRTQTLPASPSAPTGASARSRHALPLLTLPRSPTPRSAPRGLLSSGCQCERSVRCASSSSPRPPPLQCVPAHSSQCEPLLRSESSCVLLTTDLSSHKNLRAGRCCSLRCSTRAWATQPFCSRRPAMCTANLLHRPPGATCARSHCFQRKPVAQALKHRYVPYESLQDSE